MSRLDSAIRRLLAQRECLDCATNRIASKPGTVLEIGLGNGRTYDHLRSRLPGREIYVFDRQAAAHPSCIPEERHLVLGDLYETLPEFLGRHAGRVVLVHCDIGSGQPAITDPLAAFLAESLGAALTAGALVVSDQPLKAENLRNLELPAGIAGERYFMYEKRSDR